jgi:hypothetical protein
MLNKLGSGHNIPHLLTELSIYRAGQDPRLLYRAFSPGQDSRSAMTQFWQAMGIHFPYLSRIAIRLASVVPHAAGPERVFSIMKWLEGIRRNRLTVQNLNMLLRCRTYLQDKYKPL